MATTGRSLELRSYHGSTPGDGFDVILNPVRLKVADDDMPGSYLIDGIEVPESGALPVYTFVKNYRLYCNESPPYWLGNVQITFNRPFSWNGIDLFIQLSEDYVDPIAQGDEPLPGFANNVSTYSSQYPLQLSGEIYAPNTGSFGDWIQIQARITRTANVGVIPPLPMLITWDEWRIP